MSARKSGPKAVPVLAGAVLAVGLSSAAWAQSPPVANGLQIYYDPAQSTTDGSGNILTLEDQSGNNNDATPVPGAGTATLGTLNGRPAVAYDTTNDALRAAADPVGPQEGWTYFLVVRPQTFTAGALNDGNGSYFVDRVPDNFGGNPLASLKAVTDDDPGGAITYGLQVRYDDGSGLGGPVGDTPISATGVQIVTWKRNYDGTPGGGNDQFELYVNNVLEGVSPDTGANMTLDAPVLGRHGTVTNGGYAGLQGDFLVYDRALTLAEQTQVYNYLAARYVPEPSGLALLGAAALGLLSRRRRA